MTTQVRGRDPARRRLGAPPAVLAVAGAWAAVVPWAARALGVRLDVPTGVEVADHVVPGLAVAVAAAVLGLRARSGRTAAPGDVAWSAAAGVAFLAGFWIAATHAPLLAEAGQGVTPWGAALVHTSAAAPALVAGVAMLLRPLRA